MSDPKFRDTTDYPEPADPITPVTQTIKGYRQLDGYETALINEAKNMADRVGAMIVRAQHCGVNPDPRWLSIARTDLQKGFMAFVRAIAKPEGF